MKGDLSLESDLDQGTKFSVRLPDIVISKTFSSDREKYVVYDKDNTLFRPSTILVVDDIEQNRGYIKGIFRDSEVYVKEAEN